MKSFKFNFSGSQKEEDREENEEMEWYKCEKIDVEEEMKKLDDCHRIKIFNYKEVDICYIHQRDNVIINWNDEKNPLDLAVKEHSDLIAGKYEGGLKIWECTEDLIKYLVDRDKKIKLSKAKVLDLGCGVGILGIHAFINGCSVTFQDYNKEVLTYITLPSVTLNNDDEEEGEDRMKLCQFYAGDWASFNDMLPDTETYDFILTSETIYNESNYKKLIDLFTKRLSKNGTVYLAAKTCYFGVGGSVRQFEKCIKDSKLLKSKVVWHNTDGIQREILKIKRL